MKKQGCFNKHLATAGTEAQFNLEKAVYKEWAKTEKEKANFYDLERKAMQYARAFFRNICISNHVLDSTSYILPIIFVTRYEVIAEDLDARIIPEGRLAIDPVNRQRFCIRIALPIQEGRAALYPGMKRTIRHELIHYYLYINGLPCTDESALFWAYCYLFDADAYIKLSPEEEAKYQKFLSALQKEDPDTPPWLLTLLANAIVEGDTQAEKEYNFHMAEHRRFAAQLKQN